MPGVEGSEAAWQFESLKHAAPLPTSLLPHLCPSPAPQSRVEEIGQALLRNTLLSTPAGLRSKRAGSAVTGAQLFLAWPQPHCACRPVL